MNPSQFFNVRRLAVLRANALGDFIFVLPALEALRQRFPAAELVYIGRAWHEQFLRGRPSPVGRVIVLPDAVRIDAPLQKTSDVERFLDSVREQEFDLVFQMHGGGRYSNPLVREFHPRVSIGLQAEDAPPLDVNVPYSLYMPEVLRYLEVAGRAGAHPVTVVPRIQSVPADHAALSQAARLAGRHVVLHPGATDVRRRWSPRNFAEIGDRLARSGFSVCVTGSGDEQPVVEAVIEAMRSTALNLCNRISLGALAALLEQAVLVVSNDTGPLHLARALGTPTIGIYWVGNMITGGPMETAANRSCLSWQVRCPRCDIDIVRHDAHAPARDCDHAVSFVDQVAPAEVMDRAAELIEIFEPQSTRMMSGT